MSTVSQILQEEIENIVNTNTDKNRDILDKLVHIIDLSKNTLKQNLINTIITQDSTGKDIPYKDEDYSKDYTIFINAIKQVGYHKGKSLEEAVVLVKSGKFSVMMFESPEYGTLLIGGSFGIIQRTIRNATYKFKDSNSLLIRFQKYTETTTDKITGVISSVEREKTLSQIGHAPRARGESSSNISPLSQKLEDMLKYIPSLKLSAPIIKEINNLANAHKIRVNTGLFKTNLDFNRLNNIVGTGVVIVTLQTRERNIYLSNIESGIMRRVSSYVKSDKFKKALVKATSSNSIEQDIVDGISQLINPKTKKVKLATHTNKTSTKELNTASNKVGTGGSHQYTPTRLRTPKGQFTSLAAITVLLNERLAEQIKNNMGKGIAKATLNNRTGRFAESAQVNYLTQDRTGVITAFYTYMKNPYQTFEPGYEQGSPKSRDPKTLITKSIREIAISLATTRLRTVLV